MSGQAYIVMPVEADGTQHHEQETAQIASAIQQSLHEKTHPEEHDGREHIGPLKNALAHQDSLYKYINWEDPVRTFCSYVGAMGILLGAHYLPLTQLALKAGAFTLGVVAVTEFASRSFGLNTFLARLRPKAYKKISESTLNATLKDIHDLIQYSVDQAQRIIFAEDLGKTFVAFFGSTAIYWLTRVVSPFTFFVLSLTSLYVAPLVISPRGREVAHEVAHDARVRAEELANPVVDDGKAPAHGSEAKAAAPFSKMHESAMDTERRIEDIAHSGKETGVDL